MGSEDRCHFAPCTCKLQPGKLYCSDDCEQAASQGIERDFCQCSHGVCNSAYNGRMRNAVALSGGVNTAGRLTIEYSSLPDLVDQLSGLAAALDDDNYRLLASRIRVAERRPPSSQAQPSSAVARSA